MAINFTHKFGTPFNGVNITLGSGTLLGRSSAGEGVVEEVSQVWQSTGIISGGVLSINGGDNTKFDITAGSGFIVDHTTDPVTVTEISWNAFSAQTVTNLVTAFSTDIAINSSGAIVQQPSFTNTELRDLIFLGGLDHSNQTNILNTFSVQVPSYAPALSVRDLARAVGDLNLTGNVYSAASTNLTIAKTAGTAFSFGRNATTSVKDPHVIAQSAENPVTFTSVRRDGSGGGTFVPNQTNIDPNNYDDGSGTLASVNTNRWTIQRLLLFPNSNNTFIQYGNTVFLKKEDAVAAINENLFTAIPGITSALTRGYLVVQQGATNLSNTAQAEFFTASKFGGVGEPSAVQSVSTLSDTTITSVADNDILAYDSGTSEWINQSATEAGLVSTATTTVSGLTAAATAGAGARSFVTDATATTFASVVAGGGSNNVPVYSDGTNWRIG